MSEKRNEGWFEINEGLRLDSCGQDEEAFMKYLEGVQKLCTYIKEETTLTELQRNASARISILKVLATMKESLNRVENIISKPVNLSSLELRQIPVQHDNSSQNFSPEAFPTNNVPETSRALPLEIAQRKNLRLWKAYQNRWKNIKDPAQRATLNLELERRVQENLALAREKASKHRQEQSRREAEALHLAASKLAGACAASETGSSAAWNEKVALCASVLHYKQDDNWFPTFSEQFGENKSQALLVAALRRILRTPAHPLTLWLFRKQARLRDRLTGMLAQLLTQNSRTDRFLQQEQQMSSNSGDLLSMFDPVQKLSGNVADPKSFMKEAAQETNSILETFLQVFGISLDLADSSELVDNCYSILEQIFYKDLWPIIIKLYRYLYADEELILSSVCQKFKSGTDVDVNISDLLSLPAPKLDTIFVDLQHFLTENSPLEKVHSLVEITHVLCENDSSLKYEKILSADDLVGLVSCLLVQSSVPHLYAEFEALEQFIPHRFLLGEEGYSLTTFLTAIRYLESQGET